MKFIFAVEAEKPKNVKQFVDNAYYYSEYKLQKF